MRHPLQPLPKLQTLFIVSALAELFYALGSLAGGGVIVDTLSSLLLHSSVLSFVSSVMLLRRPGWALLNAALCALLVRLMLLSFQYSRTRLADAVHPIKVLSFNILNSNEENAREVAAFVKE